MVILLLVITVALTWMTNRSVFGRYIYAIGGNIEAARRAGVHVCSERMTVFALASTLAALGGVVSASREFAGCNGTGGGYLLLEALAAGGMWGGSRCGGVRRD